MADTTTTPRAIRWSKRIDGAWLFSALLLGLVGALDTGQFLPTVHFAASALAGTAPFIAFAVIAVA